jgi:drug/metabolite transporter (DMT)-like permease
LDFPAPRRPDLPLALRAAAWMAGSLASFLLMSIAARALAGRLPTIEILFFRSAVALAIVLALARPLGRDAFVTRQPGLQIARNAVHFCAQYLWVWAIGLAPLAVVTAVEFTTPMWVAALATVFLGERIGAHRRVAILCGLAGVVLIVRPGVTGIGTGTAVALGAALGFAGSTLCVKALLRTDRVAAVVFYMCLIQLPLGLLPSLPVWTTPALQDLPALIAMGVTGLTAHYSMGRALSLADASFVLPMDFLRLPVVALIGLVLYGEPIDGATVVGAALIVAGNYWSLRQEARR